MLRLLLVVSWIEVRRVRMYVRQGIEEWEIVWEQSLLAGRCLCAIIMSRDGAVLE